VSLLVRRTWGRAKYLPELRLHLFWWRIYHFVRYHTSLRVEFARPIVRKGEADRMSIPQSNTGHTCTALKRSASAGVAAGLATRRWSAFELISIPVV